MPTEPRTFVGETAGQIFGGFCGFRIGQPYQLSYIKEFDEVRIVLDHHEHVNAGAAPLVVTEAQFERWFMR